MLSKGLPEERKSVFDVGEHGLFLREAKAAFRQELFHRWLDFFFQQSFRLAGDNEIVGVADEINFLCRMQ